MEPYVTVTARAVLTVRDMYGRVARFSVPRARLDKTSVEARASANAIVESGALAFDALDEVTEAKGVSLVKTTRRQIA